MRSTDIHQSHRHLLKTKKTKEPHPMKKYGFWSFIGDLLMCLITGGLWLIWIFVREMRGRNTKR